MIKACRVEGEENENIIFVYDADDRKLIARQFNIYNLNQQIDFRNDYTVDVVNGNLVIKDENNNVIMVYNDSTRKFEVTK